MKAIENSLPIWRGGTQFADRPVSVRHLNISTLWNSIQFNRSFRTVFNEVIRHHRPLCRRPDLLVQAQSLTCITIQQFMLCPWVFCYIQQVWGRSHSLTVYSICCLSEILVSTTFSREKTSVELYIEQSDENRCVCTIRCLHKSKNKLL